MLKFLVLFLLVNLITAQTINKEPFGTLPTGQTVSIYTLENKNGVAIKVIDYGVTLVSVKIPTGNGQEEIVLGKKLKKNMYRVRKKCLYTDRPPNTKNQIIWKNFEKKSQI